MKMTMKEARKELKKPGTTVMTIDRCKNGLRFNVLRPAKKNKKRNIGAKPGEMFTIRVNEEDMAR